MSTPSEKNNAVDIANRIKNLMEKNGIAKRSQAKELSRLLGVTYSAATRKLKGSFPWSIEQIDKVASAYGEHASALVSTSGKDGPHALNADSEAILVLEDQSVLCHVSIGRPLGAEHLPVFVAVGGPGNWHVYLSKHAPPSQQFHVERLEIRQPTSKPSIAILDDHPDTADSLCDYFNDHEFEADAFYNAQELQQAIAKRKFDAYIVDWLLGTETAEANIASIRGQGNAPIFLLTGELVTGKVTESDIARVISEFNTTHFEKPIRPSLLYAQLSKVLQLAG